MKASEIGKVKGWANAINDNAAQLLRGWDAADLIAYDNRDWYHIPWRRFHATAYHYEVARHPQDDLLVTITLWPVLEHDHKVYCSNKWGPFINSMREAMWSLVYDLRPGKGVIYIALSGLPGRRIRWSIPLYTHDLFTPQA